MKFTVATVTMALFATASHAFVPAILPSSPSTTTATFAKTTNSVAEAATKLIQDAVAISEKYGKDSSEARLAWETVEEINSSDNSAATQGTLDECDVTQEWIDQACMDYSAKLDELDQLLQASPSTTTTSGAFDDVEAIKLPDVAQQKAGEPSAALQEAVIAAKELTKEHGIQSPEARVAWETVEEIASASERNDALGGKLSAEECFIDTAMEACEALNELNRVMDNRPSQK